MDHNQTEEEPNLSPEVTDYNLVELELWSELLAKAQRMAGGKTRNSQQAEDLAQCGLEKLFSALTRGVIQLEYQKDQGYTVLKTNGERVPLEAYLGRIIANLNHRRLNTAFVADEGGNYQPREVFAGQFNSDEPGGDRESSLPPPDEVVIGEEEQVRHQELIAALRQVIKHELSEQEGKVFEVYLDLLLEQNDTYGKDWTTYGLRKLVATQLGIQESQVGVVLSRVRKKLRTWLQRIAPR